MVSRGVHLQSATGKTAIFINGEKASEAVWDIPSFDFGKGDFFIGKVAGFMWGERPFYGRMSEVRLLECVAHGESNQGKHDYG